MNSSEFLKTKYASIVVTVTIVLMLILSGPANAVRMGITADNTTPVQGEEITFTVTANISGTDRYVPIENFSLLLSRDNTTVRNVVFSTDGMIISGGAGISIDPITAPSSSDYGYGQGQGMDDIYGYGNGTNYVFGYGYGYAANEGAGGGTVVYGYNVTINTSSFDTGEYNAQILLNTGNSVKSNFASLETGFTVSSKEADISSYVEPDGTVSTSFNIVSPTGNVTLTVPNGTVALDSNGNALNTSITIGTTSSSSTMNLALSSSEAIVGKVVELGPAGSTFDPYIQIRFDYDDADISGIDEGTLGIRYYNASSGIWESQTVVERNATANYIVANIEHFSYFAIVGTDETNNADEDDSGSSSGGSSSGGGGGGASGEKYENILVKEVKSVYVYKDSEVTYEFGESDNPISSLQFYAITNTGRVAASIEVLRGRSSFADRDAPGKVYRQMNIWVGKPGVIDSDTARDFQISFKIEKSWLKENSIEAANVRLLRYADDKWNELPTTQSGDDEGYVYFKSRSPGFSPFAITSLDDDPEVTVEGTTIADEPVDEKVVVSGEEEQDTEDDKGGLPIFTIIIILAIIVSIIAAGYYVYTNFEFRIREE